MTIAIYPGSFDPITNGHLDILKSGSEIFDKVIIAVSYNINKKGFLSVEERVDLIKKSVAHLKNVEVDFYDGLLADYAKLHNAYAIVKGLRAMSDFEYEFQMALTNRKLNPDVETLFLTTKSEYMYLSSSMVKQIASMGGDISEFVPSVIHNSIIDRLR